MTDGGKKNSDMLDVTVPMPVPRGQTKEPTTDEQDAPAFLGERLEPVTNPSGARAAPLRAEASAAPTDDTVVRVPAPIDAAPISLEGSFDDEVANRKVAARPARPMTRAVPEAVLTDEVMPPPSVPAPLPESVFASGPVPVAPRLKPEDPTVAVAKAPVAEPGDAEQIPTAPIPMITGMAARDLRDDEPSLPKERQPVEKTSVSSSSLMSDFPTGQQIDSELVGLVIGEGIVPIKRTPQSAPSPSVADAVFDHTVEHTPAFAPMTTEIVSRDPSSPSSPGETASAETALANDDTRVRPAPPLPARKFGLPIAALIGAIVGLLVVTAIVVALRSVRDDHEPVPPVGTAPVASAPVASAPVESAPVESAPVAKGPVESAPVAKGPVESSPVASAPVATAPVESAPVEKGPVESAPVETAPVASAPGTKAPVTPGTKTPVTNAPGTKAPGTKAPAASAPATSAPGTKAPVDAAPVAPSGSARRKDGFGPFVNRSASGAQGLTEALARGVRGALGDSAFTTGKWVGLGVRGEVRRAQSKGKTASVDCSLAIVDERGPRASLSATATAVDESHGAALRNAAERCGKSLESDLRSALDQMRR